MSSETTTIPRLTIWPKRVLYLIWGCVALVVGQALGWPTWRIALLLAPALLLEGFLFFLQKQKFTAFEHDLMQRIRDRQGPAQLLSFYREQRLLRFAAPSWRMAAKLGLIHRTAGQYQAAADAYRDAFDEAPAKEAFPLAVGLADCLFELDELDEAERVYRMAQTEHELSGRAYANLSQIIVRQSGDLQEAEDYLRLAVDATRNPAQLRCELVQLLLDQDKLDDATWELDKATEQARPESQADQRALKQAQSAIKKAGGHTELLDSIEI